MTATRSQDATATHVPAQAGGDAPPPTKKARGSPSLASDAASQHEAEQHATHPPPPALLPPAQTPKPAQTPAPSLAAARARERRATIPCTIVEEGTVAFVVTPRVHTPALASAADAQRLYIALLPDADAAAARLLIVGRKTLPADAAGTHGSPSSRAWGFVDAVSFKDKRVPALFKLEGKQEGEKPPPRVLAEGRYMLCAHGDRDAVLAYETDAPASTDTTPASEFGIDESGAFHVTVKNPAHPAQNNLGLSGEQRASVNDFGGADVVAAEFGGHGDRPAPPGGYKWAPASPKLLQVPHAEILLVGTSLASSSLSADAVAALRQAHHEATGEEEADEAWVRDVLGDVSGKMEVTPAVAGDYEEKEAEEK